MCVSTKLPTVRRQSRANEVKYLCEALFTPGDSTIRVQHKTRLTTKPIPGKNSKFDVFLVICVVDKRVCSVQYSTIQ